MILAVNKEHQQYAAQAPTPSTTAIPLSQRMVMAAFAGMGAATVCHPLDVIRVQMQTEGTNYRNTVDAAVKIYQRSGFVNGIYAGISAAYLRQWLYGSCRIGIYAYLLEKVKISNEIAGRDRDGISFGKKLSSTFGFAMESCVWLWLRLSHRLYSPLSTLSF